MKDEKGVIVYRSLLYFFENKIKVHFKDVDGIFWNGDIIDLSESKLTMVIKERVRGTLPILLEYINPNSICEFREVGG